MSDPNNASDKPSQEPETTSPAAGAAPESAAAPQPETAEPPPEQLKAIIATLQAELDKAKEQTLRLVAEMDNLRKRMEREKQDTAKFAISRFAVDIIGVVDNFERATAAVPPGAADADPALASLVEGVDLIDRELKSVLERHGVKRIWPEGEMFNPHLHQPMMQQENPDVPNGTILQVFQAGYIIDERVIRPAVVVVARGGPKAGKTDGSNGPSADVGNAEQSAARDRDAT